MAGIVAVQTPLLPMSLSPAIAQTQVSPQQVLERLFTTDEIQADWFAPSFLAQIPITQIQLIIDDLKNSLGDYQAVQLVEDSPTGASASQRYLIEFEQGSLPTRIVLDAQGQIAGLLFEPPQTGAISLEDAMERLQDLPGETSLLVLEGDSEQANWNADEPLAVGSAFKLAILAALNQHIAAGTRTWDEVVALQPQWQSLPSGFLQTWPEGSLLTLQTLAALMISQSDNTATDALLHVVGREAVEAFTEQNRPFLATREAFILKNPQNQALLDRYRDAEAADRRVVLQETSEYELPSVDIFSGDPVALDVEWFFSTRELCQLMAQVQDLPLMSINPGSANPADWSHVAFKGGSEPGVLNLTTWLETAEGTTYCVSATWNDNEPLDELRFLTLYRGIIDGLNQGD